VADSRLSDYVWWWLRHEVLEPPDSLAALASEWNCSIDTIQRGIARAKRALDDAHEFVMDELGQLERSSKPS
jgi:hypothetical protein